jgi:hypothetical protein
MPVKTKKTLHTPKGHLKSDSVDNPAPVHCQKNLERSVPINPMAIRPKDHDNQLSSRLVYSTTYIDTKSVTHSKGIQG